MSTTSQIEASQVILVIADRVYEAVCSGLSRSDALKSEYVEIADALIMQGLRSPELYNSLVSLLASGVRVSLEDILIRVVSWGD